MSKQNNRRRLPDRTRPRSSSRSPRPVLVEPVARGCSYPVCETRIRGLERTLKSLADEVDRCWKLLGEKGAKAA